jgi:hypothetical protein
MHREIDLTGRQRLVDFFCEQPLATNLGEATVLHGITGGADRKFLEDLTPFKEWLAKYGTEMPEQFKKGARLYQGERRGAGADPQR